MLADALALVPIPTDIWTLGSNASTELGAKQYRGLVATKKSDGARDSFHNHRQDIGQVRRLLKRAPDP